MTLRLAPFARAATLAAALAALATAASAQTPFTDQQKQAIGEVVKEYLIKNPEVLQEAMVELERRQQEAQKTAQASALSQSRDALLNSPRDFAAGNPSGDITLVEFFDYNCGYCKRALTDLQALMKSDPKLRVVLKDFPVLGPESVEASRVALAVKKQLKGERLFEYHVRLMETRGRINGERAIALAKEMGVDAGKLQKDMEAPDVKATIQENVVLGDRLGLSGTPAFVVGDEVISGAVGLEPMRKTVAGVRQCGKAVC
ncbi:MAG TPA: DsbA family protein [Beijerinckiaceae bacterium]|jgi:protein-disulfide isomerase